MYKFFLTLILVFSLIACDIDDEIQDVESDNSVDDSSIVNRRKKRGLQLKDGKLVSDAAQGSYI